jgi:hypothetical protein
VIAKPSKNITQSTNENERMSRRTALISGVLLMTPPMNAAQSTPPSFDGTRPFTVAEHADPQDQYGCRATFCASGANGGQICFNNGAKADAPPCSSLSEEQQKELAEELRHRADELRRRLMRPSGEEAKP